MRSRFSEGLTQRQDRADVALCQRDRVRTIATTDRARERDRALDREPCNQLFARDQPGLGQRQPPKPVLRERVDPGLIENDLGPVLVQQRRQRRLERIQIRCVSGAVRQSDIACRTRLARRKVLFGVDRIGCDPGSAGGQRGGPVPLVDVAVDHEHAQPVFLRKADRRDRKIVEDAIARPRRRQRVMAAASGVRREPALHRQFRGQPRPARHDRRTRRDRFGHRKADPPLLLTRYACAQHLGDIIRIVHRFEPAQRHGVRLMPYDAIALRRQAFADRGVLAQLAGITSLPRSDIGRVMDDRDHPP